MKRVTALITIAMACTISGCGSDPVRQRIIFPTQGSVATRGVGEKLLERASGTLVPDIEIQKDVLIGKYRLAKGRYEYDQDDAKGAWYEGSDEYGGSDEDFYIRKDDGQLCIDDANVCAQAKYVLGKMWSSISEDTIQQTLLYNGKIGNIITLGYREFFGDMARPAFSNNVKYDLSESKVVGYQGARLEIIKATNTEITYKILSGFSN